MKLSDISETTQEFVGGVSQIAKILTQTYLSFLLFPFLGSPKRPYEKHLDYTLWNLRQLLKDALGEGMDKELIAALNSLAQSGDEIQRALVVWIDLIEVLVQDTEQLYGAKTGQGKIKKAEVKAVMRYLLRAERFDIPKVPEFLEPVIIDIFVEWSIETIVDITNNYGLWIDTKPSPQPFRKLIIILWQWAIKLIGPFFYPFLWLGHRIWLIFRPRIPISPKLRSALESVESEGLIIEQTQIVSKAAYLIGWIDTHHKQLSSLVELIFAAVQEAEGFFALSGSEKKVYAHDLFFAVLDDLGFKPWTNLFYAIIDSLVNGAIEAAVHLFNKRGVFTHQHSD